MECKQYSWVVPWRHTLPSAMRQYYGAWLHVCTSCAANVNACMLGVLDCFRTEVLLQFGSERQQHDVVQIVKENMRCYGAKSPEYLKKVR